MKKTILILFSIILLFICTSCAKKETNPLWEDFTHIEVNDVKTDGITFVNEGYLTVAMSTDYAPYEFVNSTKVGQAKFVGSDVCFAATLAEAFGLKLYIKSIDFDTVLDSLDRGIADVAISGISYKPDRAAKYLFSKCYNSVGDGGQIVITTSQNALKYTKIEDLNKVGIKVGAQSGTIQVDLVTEYLPNATLARIDNLTDGYERLSKGEIDAIAMALEPAISFIEQNPNKFVIIDDTFEFNDDGNFAVVKKDNNALADAINEVITQIYDEYNTWLDEAKALYDRLGDAAKEDIQ